MDTVRQLLLNIEAAAPVDWNEGLAPEGGDLRDAKLHMQLMHQAGLFTGVEVSDLASGVSEYVNITLSWKGHDFLDSIRDDEIWRETKEGARKAGGFTFDLIKDLAKGLIKKKIEDHTGIELDLG